VTAAGTSRFVQLAAWFGLLGGPFAWTGMHVVGYGVTEAVCNGSRAGIGIEPSSWAIPLTIAAGLVTVAALATSIVVWQATRTEPDAPPPPGRVHFVATLGLLSGVVFLFLVLMEGLGAAVTSGCTQS
jgi:hypothetical protein